MPNIKLATFSQRPRRLNFHLSCRIDVMSRKNPCLERLLGLKLTLDRKWNPYIQPVAKDARKTVVSLYSSSKYPTTATILYLYKILIRQNGVLLPYRKLEWHGPYSLVLLEFKSVDAACGWWIIFYAKTLYWTEIIIKKYIKIYFTYLNLLHDV